MIIVTGGLGFIGRNLVSRLNFMGYDDIIIVDNTLSKPKIDIISKLKFKLLLKPNELNELWFKLNYDKIDYVFHLGARTDTTEMLYTVLAKLNYTFSVNLFTQCALYNIPIIYASSAATYGDGLKGYDDNIHPRDLKPLNNYGLTKNLVDAYILDRVELNDLLPTHWYGLKFFNVYGPGEAHKNRMASVVWHGYNQLKKTGVIKLFKSEKKEFGDGEQLRDFIYVEDIIDVIIWFFVERTNLSGIYNLGTGHAQSFNTLAESLINLLNYGKIEYIEIPDDLKDIYQYKTEAKMDKLRSVGYNRSFLSLSDGILRYVNKLINYDNR